MKKSYSYFESLEEKPCLVHVHAYDNHTVCHRIKRYDSLHEAINHINGFLTIEEGFQIISSPLRNAIFSGSVVNASLNNTMHNNRALLFIFYV